MNMQLIKLLKLCILGTIVKSSSNTKLSNAAAAHKYIENL